MSTNNIEQLELEAPSNIAHFRMTNLDSDFSASCDDCDAMMQQQHELAFINSNDRKWNVSSSSSCSSSNNSRNISTHWNKLILIIRKLTNRMDWRKQKKHHLVLGLLEMSKDTQNNNKSQFLTNKI